MFLCFVCLVGYPSGVACGGHGCNFLRVWLPAVEYPFFEYFLVVRRLIETTGVTVF